MLGITGKSGWGRGMGLFKTADDLFEKGNDWIKQKNFARALDEFQKAVAKYEKDNDVANINLSRAMAGILAIHGQEGVPHIYFKAAEALDAMGDQEIKFGLRMIHCPTLATECRLMVEELSIRTMPTQGSVLRERSERFSALAQKYQASVGPNSLIITEIFQNVSVTGITRAYSLFAESQENLAEFVVWSEPKKAAEYYQNARNYRKQIGDQRMESVDAQKIQEYSKAVTCWICGREITGEKVHFFPMPSEITPVQQNSKSNSPLPSAYPQGDMIYACRACHAAISKRADEIAAYYHRIAMNEIARVENEMRAQINAMARMVPVTRR
jgi:tetratricopeptide (TPR) repeat protein